MIIRLTNEIDNPVWVNMDNVNHIQLTELDDKHRSLGLKLTFIGGEVVTVQECWNDIKLLIQEKP